MKYPLRLVEYCCRFSSITLLLFFKNDSEFCGCYYYYYYYYYYSIIANLICSCLGFLHGQNKLRYCIQMQKTFFLSRLNDTKYFFFGKYNSKNPLCV